jgi:LPXTG-motif cell wall-anchored protein
LSTDEATKLAVSSTAPAQVLGEVETRVAADALPRTGSGSTAALVALGLLLLVIGGHASHKATLLLDGRR